MKHKFQWILLPSGILLLIAGLWIMLTYLWAGVVFLALSAIVIGISIWYLTRCKRDIRDEMDDIFTSNGVAATRLMNGVDVPAVIFDETGRILWGNTAFRAFGERHDIKRLNPDLDPRYPSMAQAFSVGSQQFQVMSMPVVRDGKGGRKLTFQYWLDRTEALHYRKLYEDQMPTVALIHVDNYEDLSSDLQFKKREVLNEVERCIGEFVAEIEGVCRQYENTRYFVVFEQAKLAELEKYRFALLDSVRNIDTGTPQSLTLSIAVGVSNRIAPSDESARQAMELALGRGGDQAVVKRGTSYAFYGGKRQVMTTKQSKVKTRLFAKALKQLMENSSDIFIMGHRKPDMDCLGAALGLARCAKSIDRRAYIVLDESNPTIESAVREMRRTEAYNDIFRTPEQALAMMRPSAVLIIVDTQRRSTLISPELLESASKFVVIDHHRRSVDSIENTTLNFLEAGASSACEMVTEVLQYFDDNLRPTAFECGAMLAGITVDTKHFAFNTGSRTFEAASYLRRNGADSRMVKEMFQDDMQTYRNRARVVQQAQVVAEGIALAVCPEDMPNASLIAAQAADALISIRGIEASFVLAYGEGRIMVSGRSLGEINVQIILEKLGGGGHLTVAGAQLTGLEMEEAVEKVKDCITTYLKEARE